MQGNYITTVNWFRREARNCERVCVFYCDSLERNRSLIYCARLS